jgi:hypothetical protein
LNSPEELADTPPPPHGESEPPPAAETLDEDWLTGLQRHAENATSERLQQMFGRILAGEIRRPGSFSLFTLDLVSKLSPADAANIVKIAPFVVGDILMREPIVPLHINYGIRSALGGIGVIDPGTLAVDAMMFHESIAIDYFREIFPNKHVALFNSNHKYFLVVSNEKSRSEINGARITSVGMEILSLHVRDHDAEMLRRWAADLSGQNKELYISDRIDIPGNRFRLENITKIEPASE